MNLSQLEDLYILVKAKGVRALGAEEDLRLIDGELETGVKAILDYRKQTIVAFLFAKGRFDEAQAKEWVKTAEKEGVNFSVRVGLSDAEVKSERTFRFDTAQPLATAVEDLSFEDIRGMLSEALDDGMLSLPDGSYRWPWLRDVYPEHCIVEVGAHLYKLPYKLNDEGKIELGDMEEVHKKYVPVSQAADVGGADMRVFTFRLRDAPATFAADAGDDDEDLVWKEIFQVSTTFRPLSGNSLIVEQEMIDAIFGSFTAGALNQVAITTSTHHFETQGIVPAEDTKGFVKKMVQEGESLFAGLQVIDEDARQGLEDGTILDCSVYLWADFHDQRSGDVWPWVLVHLLFTNYPQLPDLKPFGVKPEGLAASVAAGHSIVEYVAFQEETMANETNTPEVLSDADRAALTELRALQTEGFNLADIRAVQAQRQELQTQARDLEVRSIIASLEGRAARDDVVQVEGYRHLPAVLVAAERLLRESPDVAASLTQDGKSSVDHVVLSILNTLPAEARLQVSAPENPSREPPADPEPKRVSAELTDEDIAALDEQLR